MESRTLTTPVSAVVAEIPQKITSAPVVIVIDDEDEDQVNETVTKSPEGKKKQMEKEEASLPSPVSAGPEPAPNVLSPPPVLLPPAALVEEKPVPSVVKTPIELGFSARPMRETIRCKVCNIYFIGIGAAKVFI